MWRAYQLLWNKCSYIPRNVKEELFHTFNTWCFKSQKKKKKDLLLQHGAFSLGSDHCTTELCERYTSVHLFYNNSHHVNKSLDFLVWNSEYSELLPTCWNVWFHQKRAGHTCFNNSWATKCSNITPNIKASDGALVWQPQLLQWEPQHAAWTKGSGWVVSGRAAHIQMWTDPRVSQLFNLPQWGRAETGNLVKHQWLLSVPAIFCWHLCCSLHIPHCCCIDSWEQPVTALRRCK